MFYNYKLKKNIAKDNHELMNNRFLTWYMNINYGRINMFVSDEHFS